MKFYAIFILDSDIAFTARCSNSAVLQVRSLVVRLLLSSDEFIRTERRENVLRVLHL